MNDSVRKRVWVSLAVLASVSLVGVVVAGGALAKGNGPEVVCKRVGKKKVSCPKKELHGKRGNAGATGATGAQGPAGPAGPAGANGINGAGIPLIFRGQPPTANTAIFNAGGLLINASCGAGSVTTLTGVSGIPGSIFRATDVISAATSASNDTGPGQQFNLDPGEGQDNYLLTYLAGNGATIITANYGIADGGLGLVNVTCAVFGTMELAAG